MFNPQTLRELRRLAWLSLNAFCLAYSATAVSAQTIVFEKGGWKAAAISDESGDFRGCLAQTSVSDNVILGVSQLANGTWTLAFAKKQTGFTAGLQWDMELYVDDKRLHVGKAVVGSDGIAFLEPALSSRKIKSLRAGTTLEVVTRRGRFRYSLTGADDALEATGRCTAHFARSPRISPEVERVQKAVREAFVHRDALIPLANKILLSVGLINFRYEPPDPKRQNLELAWVTEDGMGGSIVILKPGYPLSMDDMANEAISRDMGLCKGNFASGKRSSRYVAGSEVKRMISSCRHGSQAWAAEYSLVQAPSGAILVLQIISPGANPSTNWSERIEIEAVAVVAGLKAP